MSHLLGYPGHERLLPDIVKAENASLFDSAGRRYVDLESGVWCASIGHAHPRVLRALSEQAARLAHAGFNYSSPIVEDAARELLALVGFDGGRCVFLCSGSDAVEYGVRAAQSVADRPLILTMGDSYFGAYGAAARQEERQWFSFDWMRCSAGEGCAEGCPHWAEIPFARIGAFLLEPGSSSGLVRFPPRGLVEAIVRSIRAAGGLVLVNEVTTASAAPAVGSATSTMASSRTSSRSARESATVIPSARPCSRRRWWPACTGSRSGSRSRTRTTHSARAWRAR
jgi:acetylornithine aminotransferase